MKRHEINPLRNIYLTFGCAVLDGGKDGEMMKGATMFFIISGMCLIVTGLIFLVSGILDQIPKPNKGCKFVYAENGYVIARSLLKNAVYEKDMKEVHILTMEPVK